MFNLYFVFNHIDLCMCKKTKIKKFHLTVKVDLVEEVYYMKQVFHLLFFKFHLTV